MNQLNSIILEGNLVKNPEYKKISGYKDECSLFVIACNRNYKNYKGETVDEVSYFDVEGFGKVTEKVKTAQKGNTIRIVGRLKQKRWIDTTGKTHSKLVVVAEHLELQRNLEQKKNRNKVQNYERGL